MIFLLIHTEENTLLLLFQKCCVLLTTDVEPCWKLSYLLSDKKTLVLLSAWYHCLLNAVYLMTVAHSVQPLQDEATRFQVLFPSPWFCFTQWLSVLQYYSKENSCSQGRVWLKTLCLVKESQPKWIVHEPEIPALGTLSATQRNQEKNHIWTHIYFQDLSCMILFCLSTFIFLLVSHDDSLQTVFHFSENSLSCSEEQE